jgi:acyl carrier protein
VTVRGTQLLVPRLVRHPPAADAQPTVSPDGWHLITGGFGGLGLAVAEWLVSQGARHLALLGRGGPDANAEARIAGWDAEVMPLAADVADAAALGAALAQLSGRPIRSAHHAAGVLDDATIAHLTTAQLQSTFAPKIQGGWNLHELTRGQPIDHFVLYSSAASLVGSTGQAAHAAANAWLDGLAHHRRSLGLPATSIAWGAWSGIGAAARLGRDDAFRRQGFGTIGPAEGLDALARLMAEGPGMRGVVPVDLPRFLAQRPAWPLFAELANGLQASTAPDAAMPAVGGIDLAAVMDETARVLGRRNGQGLDPDQTFTEFGLDSLSALELRNRLQARLGTALPATIIFEHPTPRRLADRLATFTPDGRGKDIAADTLDLAPYQTAVDAMSEAEIDALLKGLLNTEGPTA